MKPGAKYYEWEGRGVPLRLEIGPRDVASEHGGAGPAHRRQEGNPADGRAGQSRSSPPSNRCRPTCSRRRWRVERQRPYAGPPGGVHRPDGERGRLRLRRFCGSATCEAEIKEQTKATIRVLPDEEFRSPVAPTTCMWCERPERCRGRVGEGVLSGAAGKRGRGRRRPASTLFADAGLERQGGTLAWAACPWSRLPTQVGTPAYVYNAEAIRSRYRSLDARTGRRCRTESALRSRPTATSRCCGFCETWVREPTSSRRGAGPRAGGRVRPRADRVQRGGEDGWRAARRGPGRRRPPQCRIARGAGAGGSHRRGRGASGSGGHPGQSRRHHRYPSLHLHRQERDQVRRSHRPGTSRRRVHPARTPGSSSPRWRCTWGASSWTWSRSARGSAGLLDLVERVCGERA